MTKTSLPAVVLTCRNSHGFMTRAKGLATVRCPECKAPKRVPANRPKTEREAREHAERAALVTFATVPAAGSGSGLAGRWEREAPWDGNLGPIPSPPGHPVDECGECGGPLLWEPGRTVVYCPGCQRSGLPAAVTEHYRRADQRSAEVAVRSAPDAVAGRAARVRLRAMKHRAADRLTGWLGVFGPEGLSGPVERVALDYRAELEAYLPEIKDAAREAEVAEIVTEVSQVIDRAKASGALEAIEDQRAEAEDETETDAEPESVQAGPVRRESVGVLPESRSLTGPVWPGPALQALVRAAPAWTPAGQESGPWAAYDKASQEQARGQVAAAARVQAGRRKAETRSALDKMRSYWGPK